MASPSRGSASARLAPLHTRYRMARFPRLRELRERQLGWEVVELVAKLSDGKPSVSSIYRLEQGGAIRLPRGLTAGWATLTGSGRVIVHHYRRPSLQSLMIMSSERADVTICITAFKSGAMIKPTLASVRAQSFRDFRVLISIDGPDSGTEEICRPLSRRSEVRNRRAATSVGLGWEHQRTFGSCLNRVFFHIAA